MSDELTPISIGGLEFPYKQPEDDAPYCGACGESYHESNTDCAHGRLAAHLKALREAAWDVLENIGPGKKYRDFQQSIDHLRAALEQVKP